MSFRIRPLEEADYACCAAISSALYPDQPDTVESWREAAEEARSSGRPRRCHGAQLIASGRLAGFGVLATSPELAPYRKYRLTLRVAPEHRGQGIGTALYRRLEADWTRLGAAAVRARIPGDQAAGLDFVQRRGFVERLRSCEMHLSLGEVRVDPPVRELPPGITIATLADEIRRDAGCLRKLYALDNEIAADEPRIDPYVPQSFTDFERWATAPAMLPEGSFLAKRGEDYVGLSVLRKGSVPGELRQSITGVRADYRLQGIAMVLKLQVLDFARRSGFRTIVTGVVRSNEPMLALNERLGFRNSREWIVLEKPVE